MIRKEAIELEFYNQTGKTFSDVDSMDLNIYKILMIFELLNILEKRNKKVISIEEVKKMKKFDCEFFISKFNGE